MSEDTVRAGGMEGGSNGEARCKGGEEPIDWGSDEATSHPLTQSGRAAATTGVSASAPQDDLQPKGNVPVCTGEASAGDSAESTFAKSGSGAPYEGLPRLVKELSLGSPAAVRFLANNSPAGPTARLPSSTLGGRGAPACQPWFQGGPAEPSCLRAQKSPGDGGIPGQ